MAVVIVVVIVVPTSAGATGFYLRYRQKRKVVVKQRWQTSKRQALQLQAAMDGFQQQQWVQWQGWHRDSWAPYLKIVSAKLEQAYPDGARGAVPMDDKRFVDMDKMLQFRFDHQTTGRKVRRHTSSLRPAADDDTWVATGTIVVEATFTQPGALGITWYNRGGVAVVHIVKVGSAAEAAGLIPDLSLETINGESAEKMGYSAAVETIKSTRPLTLVLMVEK